MTFSLTFLRCSLLMLYFLARLRIFLYILLEGNLSFLIFKVENVIKITDSHRRSSIEHFNSGYKTAVRAVQKNWFVHLNRTFFFLNQTVYPTVIWVRGMLKLIQQIDWRRMIAKKHRTVVRWTSRLKLWLNLKFIWNSFKKNLIFFPFGNKNTSLSYLKTDRYDG